MENTDLKHPILLPWVFTMGLLFASVDQQQSVPSTAEEGSNGLGTELTSAFRAGQNEDCLMENAKAQGCIL